MAAQVKLDPAALLLGAGGVAAVSLAALALALLARRIHPGLPVLRLWLYYAALLAAILLATFALVVT